MDATDAAIVRQKILLRAKYADSGCLLWDKASSHGYGQLRHRNKLRDVHVWAFLVWNGTIPENHHVDHTCCTPLCVEPTHLEAVTQRENNIRMSQRGRNGMTQKTHCPKGHEYTKENTYYIRNKSDSLSRKCRQCRLSDHPQLFAVGMANGRSVLSPEIVRSIRLQNIAGLSGRKIAAQFDVSASTVFSILSGRTWSHVK